MRKVVLLVFGFSLLCGSTASADLFLKFAGIDGESTEINHLNWSEISTVNWGVSFVNSTPVLSDLSWNQVIDKSFPEFDYCLSSGKVMV